VARFFHPHPAFGHPLPGGEGTAGAEDARGSSPKVLPRLPEGAVMGGGPMCRDRHEKESPLVIEARRSDAHVDWDGAVTGEAETVDRPPPETGVLVRDRADRPEAEVYARPRAINAARRHAAEHPEREIAGLLLGELCEPAEPRARRFVLVQDTMRFPAVGGAASLLITPEMFHEAHKKAEERRKTIVGWYHSHPNWGIFLSESDHATVQDVHFTQPWHVALVIDPIREEYGFFVRRVGGGQAERADYFRLWDEETEADEQRIDDPSSADAEPEEEGRRAAAEAQEAESTPEGVSAAAVPARLDTKKLNRARVAMSPDSANALPLLSTTAVEVDVEIDGDVRKQTVTPRYKPCGTGRDSAGEDRGSPAASVVIDQRALAEREKRLWRDPDEVGLLLGRFGSQGPDRRFVIVHDFLPLRVGETDADGVTHGMTYDDWLDRPDELAEFAAAASFRGRSDGRAVVGWYFRPRQPSDSLPERYDAVRRTVFADHRFVSLAFFGRAKALGTVELGDRGLDGLPQQEEALAHRIFITHGRRLWDESARPAAGVDLLPAEREDDAEADAQPPAREEGERWVVAAMGGAALLALILGVLLPALRGEWLVGLGFAAAAVAMGVAALLTWREPDDSGRAVATALSIAAAVLIVGVLLWRLAFSPGPPDAEAPPMPPTMDASGGTIGSPVAPEPDTLGGAPDGG